MKSIVRLLCQVISVQSFKCFLSEQKTFHFWKVMFSSICSFCKNVDVTILHLFYECNITKALWKSLLSFFDKNLNFSFLSPQTAFLGFINTYCNDISLKNHILLLFKIYVYKIFAEKYLLFSVIIFLSIFFLFASFFFLVFCICLCYNVLWLICFILMVFK